MRTDLREPDRTTPAGRAGRLFDGHTGILVAGAPRNVGGARASTGNRSLGRTGLATIAPGSLKVGSRYGHRQRCNRSRHRLRKASIAGHGRRYLAAGARSRDSELARPRAFTHRLALGFLVRAGTWRTIRHD